MKKVSITTENIEKMVFDAVKAIYESIGIDDEFDGDETEIDDDENPEDDESEGPYLYEDRFTKQFKKARLASRETKRVDSDNIIEWLKDSTTDCAAIAAKLWPNKSEDSRRSYFYKCRDHKTYTAHGKKRTYKFSRREMQRLFAIMTNKA